jgi:hypothetical protein
MVAQGRPQHRLPQKGRVHVEDRALILGVSPVGIRVIPQHQPHVGIVAAGEGGIGVADGLWSGPCASTATGTSQGAAQLTMNHITLGAINRAAADFTAAFMNEFHLKCGPSAPFFPLLQDGK